MTTEGADQRISGSGGDGPGANAPAPEPPHDAVGAYLLDALLEEERRTFVGHLPDCASCRAEIARLEPVVGLLPRLLELADASAFTAPSSLEDDQLLAPVEPSPALRDRILTAALADAAPFESASGTAPTDREAIAETVSQPRSDPPAWAADAPTLSTASTAVPAVDVEVAAPTPLRPRGRIRPGIPSHDGLPEPTSFAASVSRFGYSRLAAAVLALVAIGSVLWALGLQSRLDDRGTEIAVLREQLGAEQTEVARVGNQSNATAWTLAAQAPAAEGAAGNLFYSEPEREVVLVIAGLPPLPEGQVYELWYIGGEGGDDPRPAGTFETNPDGTATLTLSDVDRDFDIVALTQEPAPGTEIPTGEILMVGQYSANG